MVLPPRRDLGSFAIVTLRSSAAFGLARTFFAILEPTERCTKQCDEPRSSQGWGNGDSLIEQVKLP